MVSGLLEMASSADWRQKIQSGGAVLGQDFWSQLCGGRRHGDPDGIPIRDQLGCFLQVFRGDHWPDPGDGGDVRIFSRERVHWRVDLGRETARPAEPFLSGGRRCYRQLALRFFYSGHERLYATPSRIRDRVEWHPRIGRR